MFKWFKSPKKLLATYTITGKWVDRCSYNGYEEEITFFLYQRLNGKRSWTVNQSTKAAFYETHKKFLAPVLVWVDTGEIPPGSKVYT